MDDYPTFVDVAPLAQVLVHFLLQGALVGALAACVLLIARPRRAQTRYAVCCATLAVLVACPAVTLVSLSSQGGGAQAGSNTRTLVPDSLPSLVHASPYAMAFTPSSDSVNLAMLDRMIAKNGRLIVAIWAIGAAIFGLRLIVGWLGIRGIARDGRPLPSHLQGTVDRLARQMRFRTMPVIRVVDSISQAVAVGLMRPIVLLPAAWVTGLQGDVLEAVLAHELAHLRRWDLAVNLLQRAAEALLFFHPVVWWCSRRIRLEREMCCDESAVAALGNPLPYVRALSHAAAYAAHAREPAWSVGIGGSKMVLLKRIRNVLGIAASGRGRLYGPGCALVGAALASLAWGAVLMQQSSGEAPLDGMSETRHSAHVKNRFPRPLDASTERFMVGQGVNSDAGIIGDVDVRAFTDRIARHPEVLGIRGVAPPSELKKISLPDYTIEPPDILTVRVFRGLPNASYRLQPGTSLQIDAEPAEANVTAVGYLVDDAGRIDLGLRFGKVAVQGLTTYEAASAVRQKLAPDFKDATVSLTVLRTRAMQPIAGEHLVTPDGTINLGGYGQVMVAGLTIKEATDQIEQHLSDMLDHPQVTVAVYAYNSKVYYVITQNEPEGDQVTRLPITGNETVLDAIAQVEGLKSLAEKAIWIARPAPGQGGCDTILLVNWQEITRGAATATNYQVLPGDRIFVADKSPILRERREEASASRGKNNKY